jgi:hypothetical protein
MNLRLAVDRILASLRNPLSRFILAGILIILTAALIFLVAQVKQARQVQANDQYIMSRPGPDPQIPRTTLSKAKAAFDNQAALFLDVRSSASFKTSHIPGTVNIPEAEIIKRYREIDPARWIILYCT